VNVTLPKRLAAVLSVVTAIGTPLVAYARSRGWVDSGAVELWSAEVAVVAALTGLHIATGRASTTATATPDVIDAPGVPDDGAAS
jgi:hypothetical protein